MKPKKFYHSVPFMPVRNLQETLDYYREKLGFYGEWLWGNEDAGIRRDNMHLLFNYAPDYTAIINTPARHFEIMWFVDNVQEIYDEYGSNGVTIASQLAEKPWGVREFTVQDINGYYLRIAEGIQQETK
ncbi:MAG TPA: VOC family protein [Chitinophagaceae bacterium]|nr:VOC family protein [Chitinophagaceae bacterium]